MEVIFSISGNVLIAELLGELDHHATAQIRGDIDAALQSHAAKYLVFDFSKVRYMDSSGIGMVLGRYRKMNETDGAVAIVSCSAAVIHGYPEEEQHEGIVEMEFATAPGATLIIKVRDTGVGIENIARAMEPLFTTDTGDERSGMGFTVMESFMDKIKVDSKPGKGTTVTMIKKLDTYYEF